MPNDVFLNGVPHSVQTSELTKNAINPRNTFIDFEKNERNDASTEFEKHAHDSMNALQVESESLKDKQPQLISPTFKNTLVAHDALSVPKTHLTDNIQKLSEHQSPESEMFYESLHKVEQKIQNLRVKHPSKNIQQLDHDAIEENKQPAGIARRFNDNRQLIDEKTVGDNFQKLASIANKHDNILYKEKKNIHENFQAIEEPKSDRASVTLEHSIPSEKKSDLSAHLRHIDNQQSRQVNSTNLSVEDELHARVRKMKENISKVNQSLTDIEDDK